MNLLPDSVHRAIEAAAGRIKDAAQQIQDTAAQVARSLPEAPAYNYTIPQLVMLHALILKGVPLNEARDQVKKTKTVFEK